MNFPAETASPDLPRQSVCAFGRSGSGPAAREQWFKDKNTKLFNVVVVSGSKFNPAGHLLLNVGGDGGWYFDVHEVYDYPTSHSSEQGYQDYLASEGKLELSSTPVDVPNPAGGAPRRKISG